MYSTSTCVNLTFYKSIGCFLSYTLDIREKQNNYFSNFCLLDILVVVLVFV